MNEISFDLTGVDPLIMNKDTLVDHRHPLAIEKKNLTAKKNNKTEVDYDRIEEIEFISSLYFDPSLGPVIPGDNLWRMLYDSAKMMKKGEKAKQGIQVEEAAYPLLYDGPRDVKTLFGDGTGPFVFRKSVVQQKNRIIRVRPWFHGWSIKNVIITFDPLIWNQQDVVNLMHRAGRYVGLGTWRPRHGRFEAVVS